MVCCTCGHAITVDCFKKFKCQDCSSEFYYYKGELIPLNTAVKPHSNKSQARNTCRPVI